MGLFGKSTNEKIIDQSYILILNASEKLIQAEGIKRYRNEILKRAEWINGEELDEMADALIKYAIALTSHSELLLRHHGLIRGRPFMNMAIQPKQEEAIVSSIYSDEFRSIIAKVHDYSGSDSEVPCPAEVMKWVVLKK